MKLTTKGRYAVTAMLDLAINNQHGPVCLSDVSTRQSISLSYLEQLFAKLRRAELVSSVRGPGGGYQLNKVPQDINIAEIIMAVNEPMDVTNCKNRSNCRDGGTCLSHFLWFDLNEEIRLFLKGVSLASVLERHRQAISAQEVSIGADEHAIFL